MNPIDELKAWLKKKQRPKNKFSSTLIRGVDAEVMLKHIQRNYILIKKS